MPREPVAQGGPGGGGDLGAVHPGHAGAGGRDRDRLARGQRGAHARGGLGLDGDHGLAGERAVAGRGGRERADAGGHEQGVEAGLGGGLGEQRVVAVDHPVRGARVADVGDRERAGLRRPPRSRGAPPPRSRRRPRRAPRPPPRSPRAGPPPRAPGTKIRAASPRIAATCATARPWLPALAATSVRVSGASRSARSTAHEAPSTLNAGSPSRSDSSLSDTPASPSSRRDAVEPVHGRLAPAREAHVEGRGVPARLGDRLGPEGAVDEEARHVGRHYRPWTRPRS